MNRYEAIHRPRASYRRLLTVAAYSYVSYRLLYPSQRTVICHTDFCIRHNVLSCVIQSSVSVTTYCYASYRLLYPSQRTVMCHTASVSVTTYRCVSYRLLYPSQRTVMCSTDFCIRHNVLLCVIKTSVCVTTYCYV